MGANESIDVKIEKLHGDIRVVLEKIEHIEKSQDEIKTCHKDHEERLKNLESAKSQSKGFTMGIGSISTVSFIKVVFDIIKGFMK